MLAVARPFWCPARFADTCGAQTRFAQTMRAFSPVSAALLGHATGQVFTLHKSGKFNLTSCSGR
jgi:hypothetical protein